MSRSNRAALRKSSGIGRFSAWPRMCPVWLVFADLGQLVQFANGHYPGSTDQYKKLALYFRIGIPADYPAAPPADVRAA